MAKHTPGPWIASATNSKFGSWGVFTKGAMYGVLDASAPGINSEANARLIASAPELLEALKAVSNAANVCAAKDEANANYWFAIQRQVNQAIAKAEGRE